EEYICTESKILSFNGKNIFTRRFYGPFEDQYYISPLPGEKEDHGKPSAMNDIYYDEELCTKDTLQRIEDIAYINFIEYSSNIGITIMVTINHHG
ncbi:hypothetical protein PIROE2DRAFT_10345, partial [Piromyces sp. E2]